MLDGQGLIDGQEAWRRYPRPGIQEYARTLGKLYGKLRHAWNERIAVVPFIGPGPWENSRQPLGFTRFITMMRKDPGFAHEVAGYYAALTDACVEACCAAGVAPGARWETTSPTGPGRCSLL